MVSINKKKGMKLITRAGLMLAFAVLFSIFLLQGWNGPKDAQAAITYVAMSSAGAASGNLSISAPTGLAVGDVMIISVTNRGTTAGNPAPTMGSAGWTTLQSIDFHGTSGTFRWGLSAYKVAAAGDVGATYTVNNGVGSNIQANIYAFRGVDNATPIDVQNGQANATASTTVTAPTITTTAANDVIVFLAQVAETTSTNFTTWASGNIPNASWTSINSTGTTNGSNGAAYAPLAAAGATGTGTVTISSFRSAGVLVALRPAATCVRTAPTVTFNPTSSNVAPGGNVPYTVTVTNGDTAGCSSSTFALSIASENGTAANFVLPSTLSATTPSPCTLAPGGTCTATLTVTAQAAATVGQTNTTFINATDGTNHALQTGSGNVTTTVACVRSAPTVTFNPTSGNVTPGGNVPYTVTITNKDAVGCSNSTFALSIASETGTAANFVLPSTLSATTPSPCTLAPGGTCTATLTVTAQAAATAGATNTTTLNATDGTNHAAQTGSGNVISTVACVRSAPTVTFNPTSGNLFAGGNVPYTVTITNKDAVGCSNSTFGLSIASETGTAANFVLPSTLSATTPNPCALAPNGTCTATLTVTAQAAASVGATNTTTLNATDGTNHAAQTGSGNVISTILLSNAKLLYSVNTTTAQYRDYSRTANSFGPQNAMPTGVAQTWIVDKAAPTRNEHMAGYVTATGVLYIYKWNGTSWIEVTNTAAAGGGWGVGTQPTVGGAGVNGRRFDIAYEKTTGDCMVVYSANTNGQFVWRKWNGSTWTAAATVTSARITGTIINDIKLASNPVAGSNQLAMAFGDTTTATVVSAMIWSGTSWTAAGSEIGATSASYSSAAAGDVSSFDIAYESASGGVLVATAVNGANGLRWAAYTAGAWSGWTNNNTIFNVTLGMVKLSANPSTDQILVTASRRTADASANVVVGVWSGTAWGNGNVAVATMSSNYAVNKQPMASGWLTSGGSTVAVVVYSTGTSNTINYVYWNGTTWSGAQTGTVTTAATTKGWIDIDVDPVSPDTLIVTWSDSASDLWAKRLVYGGGTTFTWTDSDGGTAETTTLASLTTRNFSFEYDRLSCLRSAPTVTFNPTSGNVAPGGNVPYTVTVTNGDTAGCSSSTFALSIASESGTAANFALPSTLSATTPSPCTLAPGGTCTATLTVTAQAAASVGATNTTTINAADATNHALQTGSGNVTTTVACVRSAPTVTFNPTSGNVIPGGNVPYTVTITNKDAVGCSNSTFGLSIASETGTAGNFVLPSTLSATTPNPCTLAPNGTCTATLTVTAQAAASVGATNTTTLNATDGTNHAAQTGSGSATTTVASACSRVLPTVSLSPSANIVSPGNSVVYTLSVKNNDSAGCAASTFNLTKTDTTLAPNFTSSTLGAATTGALAAGATFSTTITITAAAGAVNGAAVQTNATAADTAPANHAAVTSTTVITTVSTAACVAGTPTVAIAPASASIGASGSIIYSITVTDNDSSTCGQVTFNISKADAPAVPNTSFASSTLSATTPNPCTLRPGNSCTATLTHTATATPTNGATLTSTVTAAAAGHTSGARSVTTDVNTSPVQGGDGYLLKRSREETCHACHKTDVNAPASDVNRIETHNSTNTGSSKWSPGGWGIVGGKYGQFLCTTCHTGHNTNNIYLVKPTLTAPNSPTDNFPGGANSPVNFRKRTGVLGELMVNGNMGDDSDNHTTSTRVCEVCHTQVSHHRYDTTAQVDGKIHNNASDCIGCHSHKTAFTASESKGCSSGLTPAQGQCSNCHKPIFDAMDGTVAKAYKHTLGNTAGTNDSCNDTTVAWNVANFGTLNAATSRSCANMCHPDHVHNAVGGTTHNNNVHKDASTQATRSVTRDATGTIINPVGTTGTPDLTDFDNAATNGGMCLSCHKNQVNATGSLPAVSQADFNASAHQYTNFSTYGAWTYNIHDGSLFNRNCTKCHADRGDGRPNDSTTPFGAVHYSDYPNLLAGSKNANNAPATFVCYNCHGNGTTGTNLSGKDLATDFAKAYGHTSVNLDNTHNTFTELGGASLGAKHDNCLDCHDPHAAAAPKHTATTNAISNVLKSVMGVVATFSATNWTAPTYNASYAVSTLEYQICFKCHSSANPNYATWGGAAGTSTAWTDVGLEFSPSNRSGHPVVTGLNNYTNSLQTKPELASQMVAPWATNLGTQTMYCTDCHASDSAVGGPHGSATKWMLAGTNKAWPYNNSNLNGTNGTTNFIVDTGSATLPTATGGVFCFNCHQWAGAGAVHTDGNHTINTLYCVSCHIRVPHGGKVSNLINTNTAGRVARYSPTGDGGGTIYLNAYLKPATRGNYTQSDCYSTNSTCSAHSGTNTGESW